MDDISLSDAELEPDADVVLRHRLVINNGAALDESLSRIALALPFAQHQTVTSPAHPTPNIDDDLTRELAFYKQARDAVLTGRKQLVADGIPFTRPSDYFAEMIKSDGHMDRVRERLLEEAGRKKNSEDARKQRDLKKFGKQVQQEKLLQRQHEKKDTMDKIKSLKSGACDWGLC